MPGTTIDLVAPTTEATARAYPSDSLRRSVHKLFKTGRLLGVIGLVSGSLITYDAIRAIAQDRSDWLTGVNLAIGTQATLVSGGLLLTRFSRRREKQVLAELEKGQPLPADLAMWQQMGQAWPLGRKRK